MTQVNKHFKQYPKNTANGQLRFTLQPMESK